MAHLVAAQAIMEYHRRGEVLHVTSQNLVEFRNMATRPKALNGLPPPALPSNRLPTKGDAMRSGKRLSICILWSVFLLVAAAIGHANDESAFAQDAPADKALPTLWIIGDSTIRNGQDKGTNGQWGWGNPIVHYFDKTKIIVQNKAVGGTSSATFQTGGNWGRVLSAMKPGDFLILQFGHNDAFTPRGTDDELHDIKNTRTGKTDTLHTFGWFIRKYISDAREKKAAEVIVSSLIPRNRWTDGKVNRDKTYSIWSEDAAKKEKALYINLNKVVSDRYDVLGQKKVEDELFPEKEQVHPDWAGAVLNAECVVAELKKLDNCQLAKYLLSEAPTNLKNPSGKAR